jgi:hypothetical protein
VVKQHRSFVLPRTQTLKDSPRYDNELSFVHSPNWDKSPSHTDNRAYIRAVVEAVKASDVSAYQFHCLFSILITGEQSIKEFPADDAIIQQVMTTYFSRMRAVYRKQMGTSSEEKENRSGRE